MPCKKVTANTSSFDPKSQTIANSGCARHCYDFECNLKDSCSDVDGTVPWMNAPPGFVTYSEVNGVTNLDKALCINKFITSSTAAPPGTPTGSLQPWGDGSAYQPVVEVGTINVNPKCFSASVWFNTTLAKDDRLFSKASSTSGSDHVFSGQLMGNGEGGNSTNRLRFRLTTLSGFNELDTGDSAFNDGVWNHAVFWYDGCEMRIYVNGTMVASDTHDGDVVQNNDKTAIGSQPSGAGSDHGPNDGYRVFAGCLDQVVFWDCAINEDVISELYNSGDGSKTVSSQKVAEVCFNKNCTYLNDFSLKVPVKAENLCSELKCGYVTVEIVDKKSNKVVKTLANKVSNLGQWPGKIENLGQSQGANDCLPTFIARLNLCLCSCPVKMCGKKVRVTIGDCADTFDVSNAEVKINGHYH